MELNSKLEKLRDDLDKVQEQKEKTNGDLNSLIGLELRILGAIEVCEQLKSEDKEEITEDGDDNDK